jgi:hypothetical protein
MVAVHRLVATATAAPATAMTELPATAAAATPAAMTIATAAHALDIHECLVCRLAAGPAQAFSRKARRAAPGR